MVGVWTELVIHTVFEVFKHTGVQAIASCQDLTATRGPARRATVFRVALRVAEGVVLGLLFKG